MLEVVYMHLTLIEREVDVNAFSGCQALYHLHPHFLSLWARIKSRRGTTRCNLELDLIQENMTKSSQWFLRELRHFSRPWKGERSANMAVVPIM